MAPNVNDTKDLQNLTRKQLLELERKKKTKLQLWADLIIFFLPFLGGLIAVLEYKMIPDKGRNANPFVYEWFLYILIAAYAVYGVMSVISLKKGNRDMIDKQRYRAPLFTALFLLFAGYDYLTLKTGILTQPFVPCLNFVANAFWRERETILECTIHTLYLLFLGYFIGCILGLITGITCGYSKRCRYWVDPIIKFLGPIPTSTWIPIIMVVASSLFGGAVFIIALGSWFATTVASMTGIAHVDQDYFEAARTLGATNRQLVFQVAIPHAMPNIFAGLTQAMSSSCTAIMIAEMLGVKSGLGWYMNWSKSWAAYDSMFAALFVICIIFTIVTKSLEAVKRHVLRWQIGAEK